MMQSALINVMSGAAIKAGKGLLRDFGEVDKLQVSRKGTSNFVTASDIRTEKLLHQELEKARPGYSFLMEESGAVEGTNGEFRWIIDPLDGTSNFIHAISYFCISIALEKRFPGGNSDTIAALIYDPIHNEIFAAEKGKGAFVNGRRLVASTRERLEDAMVVTGNPRSTPKGDRDGIALMEALAAGGATLRYFGATALDLANVAAGRIDACWCHSVQPWDIAAGTLLVREAGGIVNDMAGGSATAYSPTLLAANRNLAAPIQKLLAKAA
jgi:myo-inositol-1(or 4)-monophosphatase